MHTIKSQIVASTHTDSQGEQFTKEFLEEQCRMSGTRVPLRQHHDLSKPAKGYMENLRVEPHPEHAGHWVLLADITVDDSTDLSSFGGFSWSSTVNMKANDPTPLVALYLPWPAYNDSDLVKDLLAVGVPLNVGRWIKKSADPFTTALVASLISVAVAPVWSTFYKDKVYPWLASLLPKIRELRSRGIESQIALSLHREDESRINVVLLPNPDSEDSWSALATDRALCEAARFVRKHDTSAGRKPTSIVMTFAESEGTYRMLSCEYDDGHLVHLIDEER